MKETDHRPLQIRMQLYFRIIYAHCNSQIFLAIPSGNYQIMKRNRPAFFLPDHLTEQMPANRHHQLGNRALLFLRCKIDGIDNQQCGCTRVFRQFQIYSLFMKIIFGSCIIIFILRQYQGKRIMKALKFLIRHNVTRNRFQRKINVKHASHIFQRKLIARLQII